MFFLIAYAIYLFANLLLYRKLRKSLEVWFPRTPRRKIRLPLGLFFIAVNAPLFLATVLGRVGLSLERQPESLLRWYFYPSLAWFAMLIGYSLLMAPKGLLVGLVRALLWAYRRLVPPKQATAFSPARRQFLAGLTPVVPTALLGTAVYGVYTSGNELEISPEIYVPIRNLPRQFDGFRITQLSDLHVGPYLRGRDLKHVVDSANGLQAEMIVITGDILDRSLSLLDEAADALQPLRAPYGVFAILGNHDYYSDRRDLAQGYPGCLRLMEGIQRAGVRFLRNARASIKIGSAELLLAGIDWLGSTAGDPNVYMRHRTSEALRSTLAGSDPESVRVLLAHHPHTFEEAQKFDIPLTLAGHTHGGGQVVLGRIGGVTLGLSALRFRYTRGLYQEDGRYLYVNRGIGYFGIPIRINCPPEISRFRLVRA